MNGLLAAKQYQLPITIVLVNNNGGGIFSFLPQANDKKHFEALLVHQLIYLLKRLGSYMELIIRLLPQKVN